MTTVQLSIQKLSVKKKSFTNCFLPQAVEYFDRIYRSSITYPGVSFSFSKNLFDFKHGLNYDWRRKEGIKTKSILIIEDEKDIADLIAYHLGQAGFSVVKTLDGPSGLEQARKSRPSLIILDLMLPGMDGKDVCRALKSNPLTQSIPILMVTAKAEEMDRIVGFELGADDYVTKPFSPRELVLRVKAVLRREELPEERGKRIQIGDLSIDIDRHQVSIKKNPVRLTSTEFKLLVELASRRGRVQTRDHLLDKVWGYTYEGYARTVDTHIRRLREKLGPFGDWIETIRGLGYRFREENE